MKKKRKQIILTIIVLFICTILFCVKLTGGKIHAILGLILMIIVMGHLKRNWKRNKYVPISIKRTNMILLTTLLIMFVTGMFMKSFSANILIALLHKVSAFVFCGGCMLHVLQHKQAREENQDVSQRIVE